MQTQLLERVTTDMVVTLDEIKQHLIVEHDEDNEMITRYLLAATEFAETRTEQTLRLRRFRDFGPCWPVVNGRYMFAFKRGPVRQIEAVEYIDLAGVVQSLTGDQWEVVPDDGCYYFNFLQTPPGVSSGPLDAVSVTYVAGYGALSDTSGSGEGFPYTLPIVLGRSVSTAQHHNDRVPDSVRQAIYMLVGHWYENRETVTVGTINSSLAIAAEDLLHQARILGV